MGIQGSIEVCRSNGEGRPDRDPGAAAAYGSGGWTAIVLAGNRAEGDPLAAHFHLESKALLPLAGEPMIAHVVRTLTSSPSVSRVVIVAQDPRSLAEGELAWIAATPGVTFAASKGGIGETLGELAGSEAAPLPVLITTADHPLLTSEMVEYFIRESSASDVSLGVVERGVLEPRYPQSRRTWMRFKGGDYTGANLFTVRTMGASAGLEALARAEASRKHQLKLLWHFGAGLALGAWGRWLSLQEAVERGGQRFGLKAAVVSMPFAEAGIDVDRLDDWRLVERIVEERANPPAPPERPLGVSVFDLDRTLTRRGTYTAFLLHCAARRSPWRLLLAPVAVPWFLACACGLMTRKRLKERLHSLLIGPRLPRTEVARLAAEFAGKLSAGGFHQEAVRRVEMERRSGRRLVVATAANAFYAEAIARELGISEVVATQSVWEGDDLVPRIAGENCHGTAKLAMLDAHFERSGHGRRLLHVRFFSDHPSDSPVLNWADEAYVVNPRRRFRHHAAMAGWPVLTWS